jgi:hypothetical protein
MEALRQLLADVSLPDISDELKTMRADRCHPALSGEAVTASKSLEGSR